MTCHSSLYLPALLETQREGLLAECRLSTGHRRDHDIPVRVGRTRDDDCVHFGIRNQVVRALVSRGTSNSSATSAAKPPLRSATATNLVSAMRVDKSLA